VNVDDGMTESDRLQEYRRLISMSELTSDGLFRGMLHQQPYLVTIVKGAVVVAMDRCPHADFPLSSARRDGDCVVCPMHNGVFDLTTGDSVGTRKFNPLCRVVSRVTDGYVEILVDPASSEPVRSATAIEA